MKKVLLFQTIGYGMQFIYVTKGKPEELAMMDDKEIGTAWFVIADIVEGIDGDINDMKLVVPSITRCPVLHYDAERRMFKV